MIKVKSYLAYSKFNLILAAEWLVPYIIFMLNLDTIHILLTVEGYAPK